MFKIQELEGGGYCTAWSMFFTELCLKNPSMTSSQIITSVFSTARLKKSILDYFRNVIRGYATFINEKIATYFKFLLDDSIIDLNKIKKMNDKKKIELTSKMIIIINIEMRLAFNPNALDDRLAFLQHRAGQLHENNVEYKYIQLEISVLNKYKNHIGDFNSQIDTPPTPPPLLYVNLNKKTQKNTTETPTTQKLSSLETSQDFARLIIKSPIVGRINFDINQFTFDEVKNHFIVNHIKSNPSPEKLLLVIIADPTNRRESREAFARLISTRNALISFGVLNKNIAIFVAIRSF
jgi:hypothetical protein